MAGVLLAAGTTAARAQEPAHHWSYSGETGPAHWAKLEEDFATCGKGKSQSPIDVRTHAVHRGALPAIQFDYQPVPLDIVDNGHSIQVNYAPGSFITVDGHRYELQQFHFHKPSEERVDGRHYDMVAHLVHKDDQGRAAVVAVLLSSGAANPLVQTLWDHRPAQGKEIHDEAVRVDAADLLPATKGYYTFAGSLTTPPCSEGVTWYVLKAPSQVSSLQIGQFSVSYPMNARPVQPLHGRAVRASE
ncbi:carbonic anhydrase family protein [Ramlibacter agri]|uniref:carbonic anhydrase n=1 Tax=Ramlibacter agri TaxID=2728837 RepID=UPI00315A017C